MPEREELINRIMEANRRFFHQHLQFGGDREWAGMELTMPQLKVLFIVAVTEGVTMTRLAGMVGMTMSTATGVADRLVAQGLLRREHDPADRRLVHLHATKAGAATIDRLTQVSREYLRLIARHLSVEELSMIALALDLIYRAMIDLARERDALRAGDGSPTPLPVGEGSHNGLPAMEGESH